jgi:hypothetical protein
MFMIAAPLVRSRLTCEKSFEKNSNGMCSRSLYSVNNINCNVCFIILKYSICLGIEIIILLASSDIIMFLKHIIWEKSFNQI